MRGHFKDSTRRRFFWLNVTMGDGCWPRSGTKANGGYSTIKIRGKIVRAHRYSYESFVGPIPEDKFVCHHCDNPACVRPDHLFLGTPKDNSHDMMRKGRNMHVTKPETLARGDKNGTRTQPETVRKGEKIEWHILTDSTVKEIREEYWTDGISGSVLSDKYRVFLSTIYKCVAGYTWKHIPLPDSASEEAKLRLKTPRHKQ